ncbi:hypothetical protein [Streptomyces sp. NPDC059166]|uniref:hypothetical protein n=1 Tax=Streptomyces sp. NPDC059166 TaxID=3346752 RepID=UPI0036B1C8E4
MTTNTSAGPRPTGRMARACATALAAVSAALLPVSSADAATLDAHVNYQKTDGWGVTQYDVRFNGTVSSDGPRNYTVKGVLDAYCHHGTITGQSVTLGYRNWNGTWKYKSYWCTDTPVNIDVRSERHENGSVELVVGATSGIANTYQYGNVEFYQIG